MTENEDITAATGDISAEAPQEPSPTAEPPPAAATADAVPAQTATDADGVAGTNPNKKRKVALFLSYVGHGYQGMQRNPGAKTIEEDLFGAIHRAGGISEANADERGYTKVHWSRAARTDKGVSAVGQVVSLMMVTHPPGVVERINAHLPPQIRVYGYHRTVKGFDARKACDKRRYEYILPTWMFAPVPEAYKQKGKSTWGARNGGEGAGNLTEDGGEAAGPLEGDAAPLANDAVADANAQSAEEPTEPFQAAEEVAAGLPASPPLADIDVDFRFDEECQRRLTSILRRYEGTHNFHNYTVRTASTAAQAMRYMLSFTCQGTFLIAGKPWVRMVVIGQSFMLHQIRKMVGMAVAEFTGVAQPGSLQYAMNTHEKVNVPMAPDLGLFLDECYYDAYNDRWGDHHEALSLGARYAEEVAKFKEEQLYPLIARRDEDEHVNAVWRRAVTEANYQFSTWPVSGKAPEVERKGEDRRDGEGAAPQAKRRKPYNPEYSE